MRWSCDARARPPRSPQSPPRVLAIMCAVFCPESGYSRIRLTRPPGAAGPGPWGLLPFGVARRLGARRGVPLEQHEVVAAHEMARDGVFDEARASIGGEFAAPSAQALHADLVELLAHIVELAVEGRERPAESFGRLGRAGDLSASR